MAGGTTVYDIKIAYSLDDRASAALGHLGAKADETARHVEGLHEGFKKLAEIFLGAEALRKGKELFIDFNSEMQQMRISMASIAQYNLGGTFEKASGAMDGMIDRWFKFSESTVLTGKQVAEFGSNILGAVINSGGTLQQVEEIAKKGSVVGNILAAGKSGGLEYVGMEVREALMGNLRKSQMFNMQLLTPALKQMGKTTEDWNKFKPEERVKILLSALSSPAWKGAINAQRDSWEGVFSTIEHKIQVLGGTIGKQVFGAIATEVGEINKWLNEHPKELEEFAQKFSSALVTGFKMIKDTVKFISDHKTAIMVLGGIFAAKGLGGGLMGMGGSLGGIGSFGGVAMPTLQLLTQTAGGFITEVGKMAQAAAGVAGALGIVYLAASKFAEWVDEHHKSQVEGVFTDQALIADRIKGGAKMRQFGREFEDATAAGNTVQARMAKERASQTSGEIIQILRGMHAFDETSRTVKEKELREGMNAASLGVTQRQQFAQLAFEAARIYAETHTAANFTPGKAEPEKGYDAAGKPTGKAANVNVRIDKIEVASDDPDRFVFGAVKAFEKINRNPAQAEGTIRGGF